MCCREPCKEAHCFQDTQGRLLEMKLLRFCKTLRCLSSGSKTKQSGRLQMCCVEFRFHFSRRQPGISHVQGQQTSYSMLGPCQALWPQCWVGKTKSRVKMGS